MNTTPAIALVVLSMISTVLQAAAQAREARSAARWPRTMRRRMSAEIGTVCRSCHTECAHGGVSAAPDGRRR